MDFSSFNMVAMTVDGDRAIRSEPSRAVWDLPTANITATNDMTTPQPSAASSTLAARMRRVLELQLRRMTIEDIRENFHDAEIEQLDRRDERRASMRRNGQVLQTFDRNNRHGGNSPPEYGLAVMRDELQEREFFDSNAENLSLYLSMQDAEAQALASPGAMETLQQGGTITIAL